MIRYANERAIRRNARLGRILTFGGLGVLVLGLILSVAYPAQVNAVLGMALVGVLASQFGMVFYNRWSRQPRMDQVLDDTVKGLDGRYALFHYTLSSPHVLATPAGVYAIVPRLDEGEVTWSDGVWSLTRAGRGTPRPRVLRGIEGAAQTESRRCRRCPAQTPAGRSPAGRQTDAGLSLLMMGTAISDWLFSVPGRGVTSSLT